MCRLRVIKQKPNHKLSSFPQQASLVKHEYFFLKKISLIVTELISTIPRTAWISKKSYADKLVVTELKKQSHNLKSLLYLNS